MQIKQEIERTTERRAELWHALSQAHEQSLTAELRQVEERLAELWEAQRVARAQLRFGERELIIARARAEERIDRAA